MTLDACDDCGQRPATQVCFICGILVCAAHKCCPDCQGELTAYYREPDARNDD